MTAGDRPRRPHISDEDAVLWEAVARTVKPLKRRRPIVEAAVVAPQPKPRPMKATPARQAIAKPTATAPRPVPAAPPLIALARRDRQRLSRGTDEINARLDLHGRTQAQAHTALLRFLRNAQARGDKTVLVITGKGGAADSERGVLRRQVPLWLSLPEFRALVIGFSAAAIGHGGEGALYVRVRRARE